MSGSNINIHKNYPGGNIRLIGINGNDIFLEQEIRDTTLWWFYWGFCIENPPEGEFTFHFTNGDVVGPWGPAFSYDRIKWDWLYKQHVTNKTSFRFCFNGTEEKVFFCISIPYQLSDYESFYNRNISHHLISQTNLTISEEGRPVPLLRIGRESSQCNIILTCRHHACESIASHVLEGLIDFCLQKEFESVLSSCCFYILPFMDIDGVENGDQGKCRHPHDHGDDYSNNPIYKTTAALMELSQKLKPVFYLDFHCPWIWAYGNKRDDHLFFGKGISPMKERIETFGMFLNEITSINSGDDFIRYDPKYDIETGEDWMIPEEMKNSASTYFSKLDTNLSVFIEIPYFRAGECIITQQNTRKFGADIGKAIRDYLSFIKVI